MPQGRFTLCFCRSNAQVLMLRRSRPPFVGLWNGLGGKVNPAESDAASALRELREEADIHEADIKQLVELGEVSWTIREAGGTECGSMTVYLVDLIDTWERWAGIRETPEGALAWLPEEALFDRDTQMIVPNIPLFYPAMLADAALAEYRCAYEGSTLLSMERVLNGSSTVLYGTGVESSR